MQQAVVFSRGARPTHHSSCRSYHHDLQATTTEAAWLPHLAIRLHHHLQRRPSGLGRCAGHELPERGYGGQGSVARCVSGHGRGRWRAGARTGHMTTSARPDPSLLSARVTHVPHAACIALPTALKVVLCLLGCAASWVGGETIPKEGPGDTGPSPPQTNELCSNDLPYCRSRVLRVSFVERCQKK